MGADCAVELSVSEVGLVSSVVQPVVSPSIKMSVLTLPPFKVGKMECMEHANFESSEKHALVVSRRTYVGHTSPVGAPLRGSCAPKLLGSAVFTECGSEVVE